MSSTADPYLEWNAAYILGSLSPSERREYEQHLAECAACARAVASLAGMAGILSTVPTESAMALLGDDTAARATKSAQPDTLPQLLRAAQRTRRRARVRVAVLVAVVAAIAATITMQLPLRDVGGAPADSANRLAMEQTFPSPITAEIAMTMEAWGTRIEGTCRYAMPTVGVGETLPYSVYVTTKDGASIEVASWTSAPGSELDFIAMVRIPRAQISSIDIRRPDNDTVLLKMEF